MWTAPVCTVFTEAVVATMAVLGMSQYLRLLSAWNFICNGLNRR